MKIKGRQISWQSILGWSIFIVPFTILSSIIAVAIVESSHTWSIIFAVAVIMTMAGLLGGLAGYLISRESNKKFDELIKETSEAGEKMDKRNEELRKNLKEYNKNEKKYDEFLKKFKKPNEENDESEWRSER